MYRWFDITQTAEAEENKLDSRKQLLLLLSRAIFHLLVSAAFIQTAEHYNANFFLTENNKIDHVYSIWTWLYVTIITTGGVGYGDIVVETAPGRFAVVLVMLWVLGNIFASLNLFIETIHRAIYILRCPRIPSRTLDRISICGDFE